MSEFDANPDAAYDYRMNDALRELREESRKLLRRVAETHDVGEDDLLMLWAFDDERGEP